MNKIIEKVNEYLNSAMEMSNIKDKLVINRMRIAIRSAQDCLKLLGSGYHDRYEGATIEDPFSLYVEEYIKQLKWSANADEESKTLVAGNIRAFADVIKGNMFDLFGPIK